VATTLNTRTPRKPLRSSFLFGAGRRDEAPSVLEKVRSGVLALVVMAVATGVLVPVLMPFGLGADAVTGAYEDIELPPPNPGLATSYLYDRDGRPLTALHGEVDRTPVPLSQVSPWVIKAVLSAEDVGFYQHGGVSPMSIMRAAWANIARGQVWQGGSTLTEQYVTNAYGNVGPATLLERVEEAVLAMKLERRLSKDQILQGYLNRVYFGQGAYGIFAAAKTYFNKHPAQLTVLEAATLAGVISRPARWNPVTNPPAGKYRRDFVLDRMAEEGFIPRERAERLKRRGLGLDLSRSRSSPAAYFVTQAKKWLERKFGAETTFGGGLRVTTTIDMDMQRLAEAVVSRWLPVSENMPAGAMVVIDPATGAVRAMVGDSRFPGRTKLGRFNLAVDAHRQTGSAFKPFTLAAAMEDRISLQSTWEGPSTIEIEDPSCQTRNPVTGVDENWTPVNAGDSGVGRMSLLSATAHSVNTIYAQLVLEVDKADVAEIAKRMGMRSELKAICSITLGANDVTVLDMTTAFATLASRGVRRFPVYVEQVRKRNGAILAQPTRARRKGTRVLDQNDADLVTYALETVVDYGTGYRADIGRPVAGKTGSAEENTNAYFCGYIPQLVACVWVGFPGGLVPMTTQFYGGPVYGGTIPASIWHDFMAEATAGMPVLDFAYPSFAGYNVFPEGSGVPIEPTGEPTADPTETPAPEPTETETRTPTPTETTSSPPPTTTPPTSEDGDAPARASGHAGPGAGAAIAALGVLAPLLAGGLRASPRARRSRRGPAPP
jgi:penicillin-binding protein 1A